MFSRKLIGSIAVVAMVIGVAAAAYAIQSGSGALAAASTAPGSGGGGSNARSGPAAGGTAGIVDSVSASGFTVSTATGEKVAVNEASSTTYQQGTSSASANAITAGETVLVLGTTSSTTITATQVIVQPTGDYGSAASSTAGVVAFQQGAPSTSKQVGQIPANYSQGSGTIVSGTTANNATEAALAAYPGGVVDRVVQLSDASTKSTTSASTGRTTSSSARPSTWSAPTSRGGDSMASSLALPISASSSLVRALEKIEVRRVVGLTDFGQVEAELPKLGALVGEKAVERVVEHCRDELPHDQHPMISGRLGTVLAGGTCLSRAAALA
jgi:hypothetical protein